MRLNSRTRVSLTRVGPKQTGLTGLTLVLIIVLVMLCVCTEAPFQPDGTGPMDYPVYLNDPNGSPQILIFYPLSQSLDSVDIPWSANYGVTVSADGKRLYLTDRNTVYVVDAESFVLITELSYNSHSTVAVSPDNNYLAITGDDLHILSTSDFSVVFSDTNWTYHGRFSSDSKYFYCSARTSSSSRGFVYKVDLTDSEFPVTITEITDGSVRFIIPSPDETKWFLYLGLYTWTSAFEVYDTDLDSIIYREIIQPGYGNMVMSPDGKNVFYTNPGNGSSQPDSSAFTIFNVETNEIDTVVTGKGIYFTPPNHMTITPDGRFLVMLGGAMALMELYLYDIEKRGLVYRNDFGAIGSHVFSNLSTQIWK